MELAYIKWVDSFGVSSSWGTLEPEHCKPIYCESIGYVVFENDEIVTVAPHRTLPHPSQPDMHYCGDMTIPKVAVVERKVLNGNN
jgi:hypothetical protein